MKKEHFSILQIIIILFISISIISSKKCFAKFKINSSEIKGFVSEKIKYNSKKFNIPKEILEGLLKPYTKNGKIKDIRISSFARDEIAAYIKANKHLGISPDYIDDFHPVERFITFLSISLIINKSKINQFITTNGLEINKQNLWIFSSIAYLFGMNTSLELINYYSQINSPRFLQYMLKDDFIMKKYLCDSRTLWRCFTNSLESVAAIEKKEKLLKFFSTFNYCGVPNYGQNQKTKTPEKILPTS
jgi:hypothetical protein